MSIRINLIFFVLSAVLCQGQDRYFDFSEKELIQKLHSDESQIRYDSASEIKRRILQNEIVIERGNIIENTQDFWLSKISSFKKMTDIGILLDSLEIESDNLTPNYGNTKIFRLDHLFLMYVELNKKRTKGKVVQFFMNAEFFKVEPPKNFTGLWRIYNVIGEIAIETSYKNGKNHGVETIFYDDGQTNWSKFYVDGKIQLQLGYSEKGELISERTFDDKEREVYEKELQYEMEKK